MEITFKTIQQISEKRKSKLWYGGIMQEFTIPELGNAHIYRLSLVGRVECGMKINNVADKLHFDTIHGLVNTSMIINIDNDVSLLSAMNGKHREFSVEIYNNNKFAIQKIGCDGKHNPEEDYYLESSSTVEEAIEEILSSIDKIISHYNTDTIAKELRRTAIESVKTTIADIKNMLTYGLPFRAMVTEEDVQNEINRMVTGIIENL